MSSAWQASGNQLPLLRDQGFLPMPHGSKHYVVALQNKKGELDALRQASAVTWDRLTPLVQFVGPKRDDQRLTAERLGGWARRAASAVGSRACFVDLLRLRPTALVETNRGAVPALALIHQACRNEQMKFVPVVPLGCAAPEIQLARNTVAIDNRGACVRYRVMEAVLASGTAFRDIARTMLQSLDLRVEDVDLILDLGFLAPDADVDTVWLLRLLEEAAHVGSWRSLVLLGSSIPPTMGCIPEGQVGTIPRLEWQLRRELISLSPVRIPSFGDYAVQNPKPPVDGGGPGMRANIRCTTSEETFVARGIGSVLHEGRAQYRALCADLVALGGFAGGAYSWGDKLIADCAAGVIEPGAQNMWRGAGTSHHLQLVADQISS